MLIVLLAESYYMISPRQKKVKLQKLQMNKIALSSNLGRLISLILERYNLLHTAYIIILFV